MVLGIGQVAVRDRLASSGLLKNVLEFLFLLSENRHTYTHTHIHKYTHRRTTKERDSRGVAAAPSVIIPRLVYVSWSRKLSAFCWGFQISCFLGVERRMFKVLNSRLTMSADALSMHGLMNSVCAGVLRIQDELRRFECVEEVLAKQIEKNFQLFLYI